MPIYQDICAMKFAMINWCEKWVAVVVHIIDHARILIYMEKNRPTGL